MFTLPRGNDPIWLTHIFQLGGKKPQICKASFPRQEQEAGGQRLWPLFCYVFVWILIPDPSQFNMGSEAQYAYVYIMLYIQHIYIHICCPLNWLELLNLIILSNTWWKAVKDSVGSMHELCFLICSESLSHWLNLALPQNNPKQPWIIFATGKF